MRINKSIKTYVNRCVSFLLAIMLVLSSVPAGVVYAIEDGATKENPIIINDAAGLISATENKYYVLGSDILLSEGQQIASVEGTLDGKGHTVTLSGKALASDVSGTIQNLGLVGTVVENKKISGSFAENFSGSLLNCYSKVKLSTSGWFYDHGGLVGVMSGGLVQNCYFAGTTTLCGGGIGGKGVTKDVGTVKNCYYTAGMDDFAMTPKPARINLEKKKSDELKTDGANLLNTEKPDTGYKWSTDANRNDGLPILIVDNGGQPENPPVQTVDRTDLQAMITKAQGYTDSTKYTKDSWDAMQRALEDAILVNENTDAKQKEVDSAKTELETAIDHLVKIRITEPVEVPDNAIEISSQSDFKSKIEYPGTGKYYVLTNDITLDSMYFKFASDDFNGMLDGQGHTITFKDAPALFHSVGVGEDAVIQNIRFEGKVASFTVSKSTGSITEKTLKGSVINCSSNVTKGTGIDNIAGFANSIDGGVISNCYVIGKATNAFANSFSSGKILNSYWMSGIANNAAVESGSEMMASQMQNLDFVELLNRNKGEHGTNWGQNSDGFPYFGENKDYSEPGSGTYGYEMTFRPYNSDSASIVTDNQLTLLTGETMSNGFAGTLNVKGFTVPNNKKVIWSVTNAFPEDCVAIAEATGEFYIYNAGEAVVRAQLADQDGNVEKTLVEIKVTTITGTIEAIKLFIDGIDVTNGAYTVQGSEQKSIQVRAKYVGKEGYIGVTSAMFDFATEDTGYLDTKFNYSTCYFKKPGSAKVNVVSKDNQAISASVDLNSTYVAATSIKPGIAGTIKIHGRNANDWQNKTPLFNPIYNGVIIEPANASYASDEYWTVTSSDNNVGIYGETAYIPTGAGNVTYTAKLSYVDPNGKQVELSGSEQVTFQYDNPLKSISVDETNIEVQNNTQTPIAIDFTGTNEGWSISEPTIEWTYDKEGIVTIFRNTDGDHFIRDEGAKDNNMFVLGTEYKIKALSEGTVIATGTPKDKTGGAKPIKLTISVGKGEALPEVDIEKIIAEGIDSSEQYLNQKNIGYVYGSEWLIVAQIQAGQKISSQNVTKYLESLNREMATWSADTKPTDIERVALTLTILGKDIENYNGKNLAEMIYNHKGLDAGSNELIFAIIAMDGAKITLPADSLWTRQKMIDELLTFQNVNGGFGLDSPKSASVDLTAMALQALAPYQSIQLVKESMEKAMEYLKNELDTVSYGYGTAEADAQVILALAILEKNAETAGFGTKYENIFSHLVNTYAVQSGGFRHDTTKSVADNMATIQVLQGLEAYRRYLENEASYWELSAKMGQDDESVDESVDETVEESVQEKNEQSKPGGTTHSVDEKVSDVIKGVNSLSNLKNPATKDIIALYKEYCTLSDAKKSQVTNYKQLNDLLDIVAVRNHTDEGTGIKAGGLEWNIKIETEIIKDDSSVTEFANSIGDNELLELWEISLTDVLTNEKYSPTSPVKISIPVTDLSEYQILRIAHWKDDNSMEYLDCKIEDEWIHFYVSSFSKFGLISGQEQSENVLEDVDAEAVDNTNGNESNMESKNGMPFFWVGVMAVGMAAAVTIAVVRKKNTKE